MRYAKPGASSPSRCALDAGLEHADYDKGACQDQFDAYKECKKQEVEGRKQRRLEERAKGSGLLL